MVEFLRGWQENGLSDILFGLFILVVWAAVYAVPTWRYYARAGIPGWPGLSPFFRQHVDLKVANMPGEWTLVYLGAALMWAIAAIWGNPLFIGLAIAGGVATAAGTTMASIELAKGFGLPPALGVGLASGPIGFVAALTLGAPMKQAIYIMLVLSVFHAYVGYSKRRWQGSDVPVSGMTIFIGRRFIEMSVLFLVFVTISFILLTALPGDAVRQQFANNPNVPPEAAQIAIERLGLDEPLLKQYSGYVIGLAQLDLGFSFIQYPRSVNSIIAERIPRTLVLFLIAVSTYYWAGFIAGKFIAWRRGQRGEHAITIGGVALFTVFYPWFALMLILFLGFHSGFLPINKFLDPDEWVEAPFDANRVFLVLFAVALVATLLLLAVRYFTSRVRDRKLKAQYSLAGYSAVVILLLLYWYVYPPGAEMRLFAGDIAHHIVLPVATLTLINFAGIMLVTRSSMLETMKEDFITTARAKGVSESGVRDKHAARTALLPVTTGLVLALTAVIDGGIVTETVFSWPGMGQVLFASVISQDLPLSIAAFSFIGVLAMVGHLIVDVMYVFLDPRIRV